MSNWHPLYPHEVADGKLFPSVSFKIGRMEAEPKMDFVVGPEDVLKDVDGNVIGFKLDKAKNADLYASWRAWGML